MITPGWVRRDLPPPLMLNRLRERSRNLTLLVIAFGVPSLAMLGDESCHLMISPRLHDGTSARSASDHRRTIPPPNICP